MSVKAFPLFLFALLAAFSLAACGSQESKLSKAEALFDKGEFEKAQFEYFELLTRTDGPMHEKVVESLTGRLEPFIKSPKFDPKDYPDWVATLEADSELKTKFDGVVSSEIKRRVEELLVSGKLEDASIMLSYLPEGADDGGLGNRIKNARLNEQESIYQSGLALYKNHKYDEAVATWDGLDPASSYFEKAKAIKEKIPGEKISFFIGQARKRPLDGFKLTDARPVARVIFNRVQGQGFETLEAPEDKEYLKVEARIGNDIDLVAWYVDKGKFVSVGRLERQFVRIDADDPEAVKRSFKKTISKSSPAEVVYFIVVEFDFHRKHDIYVSDSSAPYKAEDLNDLSIVTTF